MARGGYHPPHCRAQLKGAMRTAHGNKSAMSRAMKDYQACRRAAGAIGKHRKK